MRVAASIVVPTDVDDAWRTLLAWESQARWMRDADAVRVIGTRRAGVGTRVAVRTRVLGVPAFTETLEVTVWDPPARVVMAHHGAVRGAGEWRLHATPDGTKIVWTEQLAIPVPILGELALLAYRPVMARLMRRSLAALQSVLRDRRDRATRPSPPASSSA